MLQILLGFKVNVGAARRLLFPTKTDSAKN